MKYSKYIPKNERPVITALIRAALEGGNAITVNDSEDDVLTNSRGMCAIREALGGSGEDLLYIQDSAGRSLGWFWLIYNNGSEGDPMIVIADYAGNEYCDRIWNTLYSTYG